MLVKELLPLLEKTAQKKGDARIVHHSSVIRHIFPIHTEGANPLYYAKLGDPGSQGGNKFGMMKTGGPHNRYHQSKLANMLFTSALQDKLLASGSKVKALVAAPGLAATDIFGRSAALAETEGHHHLGFGGSMFMRFIRAYQMQSAVDGSVPLLTCMVLPTAESGQLYEPLNYPVGGRVHGPAIVSSWEPICKAQDGKALLWAESEKAVGAFTIAEP